MTEAFERELRKFDIERVLPAWDSLITSQQAALVSHDVPTMFPTTSVNNREVCFPFLSTFKLKFSDV